MQSIHRCIGRTAFLLAAIAATFVSSNHADATTMSTGLATSVAINQDHRGQGASHEDIARDSLKPITRSADTSEPSSDMVAPDTSVGDVPKSSAPVVTKGIVTSEPAPGVADEPSASASRIETSTDTAIGTATETTSDRTPATTTSHATATPAINNQVQGQSQVQGKSGSVGHGSSGPSTAPAAASAGVSAEQSLKWLTNGNIRFVKKNFRKDGRSEQDRKRLLAGQKPHAIVLSCADSRVPPEIIFDQALGEIFTIRVAGEALDSSVIASIEYAVEHLGSKLLIVMGHTQCGAVKATLTTKEGDSAGSESLDKMIADIRPHLKTVSSDKTSPNLEIESTLNADGVARDLVHRSAIIRKKVEAGELKIKPALYRMDSGKVSFY